MNLSRHDLIRQAVAVLAADPRPQRVILFGSQARGDADAASDIDLLIVEAAITDRSAEMVRLWRLLGSIPAAFGAAACRVLEAAPDMHESVIGFHAQQACEKCLKAVLSHAGIAYERTHDLPRLMNLLRDNGIEQPAGTTWIDELMP